MVLNYYVYILFGSIFCKLTQAICYQLLLLIPAACTIRIHAYGMAAEVPGGINPFMMVDYSLCTLGSVRVTKLPFFVTHDEYIAYPFSIRAGFELPYQ